MGSIVNASDSAQALFLSLITHQVTPWQFVCHAPAVANLSAKELSALLFSDVLQPMWWCCRGPGPVAPVQKNSLSWMALLVMDPTPAAGHLCLSAAASRLPCVIGEPHRKAMDRFLLRCFQDFASADEFYKKGG